MKTFYRTFRKRHIFLNLGEFIRQIKWGIQRFKRGWSDDWAWSIDYTLESLLPELLDQLADNCHGYPDGYTPESWVEEIKSLSFLFKTAHSLEENGDYEQGTAVAKEAWCKFLELKKYLWD